jgi:hypothetical protein
LEGYKTIPRRQIMAKEYSVVKVDDVAPEPIAEVNGWRKMDIRFIITAEKQELKNCTMFWSSLPSGGPSYETPPFEFRRAFLYDSGTWGLRCRGKRVRDRGRLCSICP